MSHMSNADVRAILLALVARMGGAVEISHAEIYDLLMPSGGTTDRLDIESTATGVRISVRQNIADGDAPADPDHGNETAD